MLKFAPAFLAFCMAAVQPASLAPPQDDQAKNTQQARAALDAMVKALGGDAWLNMKNREYHGRSAAFFQGKPSGAEVE